MTEYYNINNNNYNNNDTDKLDRMAREINKKKTSLCKKVVNEFNDDQEDLKNGICSVVNSKKFSYLPINKNYNNGLYNDGLYNDGLNDATDYSISDSSDISYAKDNKYFPDTKSVDSFFDNKSLDMYLESNKNKTQVEKIADKKNVKFHKLVESIDYDDCSKDDDDIFKHIKRCNNCRDKLLKFLNNSVNSKKNNYINSRRDYNIKEIVIFLMVGIFIIIMFDILLKYRRAC